MLYHVRGAYYQHALWPEVSLAHLSKVVFIRFLSCEVALFSLLCLMSSLEGIHCAQPTGME